MAQVKNLSRRLVSFSGNSGQTWHIAPGTSIELEEFELQGNAKLGKLTERRLIDVLRSGKSERKTAGEERDRGMRTRSPAIPPVRAPQGD